MVLLPIAAVLLLLSAVVQWQLDPVRKKIQPSGTAYMSGLNNEFLLLPLLGFREAAAGLLWVRADEFFHSGDYDAILPLVRLITWLDPHSDNVYTTGAWHLSYNFTDSSERSDRRYIPPALKLLDEGIDNNPNIPDIKFEKGWELYDKIKNFHESISAYQRAVATPITPLSDDPHYGAPLRVWHALAHAYEKAGRIPEAIGWWQQCLDRSNKTIAANKQDDFAQHEMHEAEIRNLKETEQRYRDRYKKTGHSSVNPTPYPAILAPPKGSAVPAPWVCSFHPRVEIVRPKVFKVSGRLTVADGARVDVQIADEDYKPHDVAGTLNAFNVDPTQTICVDALSVRKTRFEREIDMSRDPKMYSFTRPYYRVVLSYNTRTTSPFLQDRFGWNGEGITDVKEHVWLDPDRAKLGTRLTDAEGTGGFGPVWDGSDVKFTALGQPPRLIRVVYRVSRDDILNGRTLTDKDIVSN
jgi:tetratricopeptide (TPR) repeat protein